MNILSKYTWNSCLHLLPEWWAEAQVWRGGRPPQPCNFKRGREREWFVLARPFACMHKQEGRRGKAVSICGRREERRIRRRNGTNPFARPSSSSVFICSPHVLHTEHLRIEGERPNGFPGLPLNAGKVWFLSSYCSRTVLTWQDSPCIESLD